MSLEMKRVIYSGFKTIESFGHIYLMFEGDAKKIGLNKDKLEDYLKLKFKNNFADVKYNYVGVKELERLLLKKDIEKSRKVGRFSSLVWITGNDYPIAFFVRCEAGNYEELNFWNFETLGYGSKKNVPGYIKKTLGECVEKLAVDFFKVRGEL